MTAMPEIVEQVVQARLVVSMQRSATLRVMLRYSAADPLAVRMAFPAEFALDAGAEPVATEPEIEWVFARELLAAGLDRPSGLGDVRIRPTVGQRTMVELHTPEGAALLQFDTTALRGFLWRSFLTVPEGTEVEHLDRALADLLG
jgi:hypothetical protein